MTTHTPTRPARAVLRGPATVVLLGVLAGGCGRVVELATPPPPLPTSSAATATATAAVDAVNERLAAVAAAQRAVEPDLDAALALAGDVDAHVAAVRDPDRASDTLAAAAGLGQRLGGDPSHVSLLALLDAVDAARGALDEAAGALGPDAAWEAEWLDAQARVLGAVEARARATAQVLDALADHRAAAREVVAVVAAVEQQRDRYRDGGELAGTIEVDAARPLRRLVRADDALAAATASRAEATTALNAADAAAAEVFARRPGHGTAVGP